MALTTPGMDGWLLLIVSIGTSTTVGGIINAYLSRRKTNADVSEAVVRTGKTAAEITGVGASTAETQVTTSLSILAEMRADMVIYREELAEAKRESADARAEAIKARKEAGDAAIEVVELQVWRRAYHELLSQHMEWDTKVVQVVRQLGGSIEPPPPLDPWNPGPRPTEHG